MVIVSFLFLRPTSDVGTKRHPHEETLYPYKYRFFRYESAWIILTDLEPEEALVSWYGLRTWIEGGFKDAQTRAVGLAP